MIKKNRNNILENNTQNHPKIVLNIGEAPDSSPFIENTSSILLFLLINILAIVLLLIKPFKPSAIVGIIGLFFLDIYLLINYFISCRRITVYEGYFEIDYGYKVIKIEFNKLKFFKIIPATIGGDFDFNWETVDGKKGKCNYKLSYKEEVNEGGKKILVDRLEKAIDKQLQEVNRSNFKV